MLWILAIWLVAFLALTGVGLLTTTAFMRWGGVSFRSPTTTFEAFWLGYVAVIAMLELWSFVAPIDAWPVVAVAVASVAGYGLSRRAAIRHVRRIVGRPRWAGAMAVVVLSTGFVVASRSGADPVGLTDTVLYHLQVVRWNATFPVVPGLANLHARLGYNNSIHLFAALIQRLWLGQAMHLAIGLLSAVIIIQWFKEILSSGNRYNRFRQAYCLLTLPFLLGKLRGTEVSSLSTDLPLAQLGLVIGLELLSLRTDSSRRLDLPLARVLGLAAVALTTKLGGMPLFGAAFIVAVATRWSGGVKLGRRILPLAILPAAVLFPYLGRNAMLSGWLLFPTPMGNLHLSWSLPEYRVIEHFRWIESWARIPGRPPSEVLDHGFVHWFVPWFSSFRRTREMVLFLAASVLLVFRFIRRSSCERLVQPLPERVLVACCLCGLILWFRGAPDPRFGAPLFWVLFGAAGAPVLAALTRKRAARVVSIAVTLGFACWAGHVESVLSMKPNWWDAPRPAVAPTKLESSSPGLQVLIPVGSDQCSDAELPCTPEPGLQRLRRVGSLADGFLPNDEPTR
jgi:hypothetical protein